MYRTEYPRPQFVREEWMCLNGEWEFEFDDENLGLKEHWERAEKQLSKRIQVPFVFQSALSGIEEKGFHDCLWYKRKFQLPAAWSGKKIMLHFGAIDFQAHVYVNGFLVGMHVGGNAGCSFDISDFLKEENEIAVRVYDPSENEEIPRGKQSWIEESQGIWYTRCSGIWQTVWLEPVSEIHIQEIKITPDIDKGTVSVTVETSGLVPNLSANLLISFDQKRIVEDIIKLTDTKVNRTFDIFQSKTYRTNYHGAGLCWSPETPNLFDVTIRLYEGEKELDEVTAYFGMRKIHTKNGMIYLNNKPYFQKLVLDQGYWPQSLWTAPHDEDFVVDITYAKKMGFNGCRKHQKIEDPRFLYWADKLGFLVWGELPSAPAFSEKSVSYLVHDMLAEIHRDYNHPCVVAWVPLNESWGVMNIDENDKERSCSMALYYLIHSVDNTRLVISNDGWQMTVTDICGIHNYNHGTTNERKKQDYFKKCLHEKEELLASVPSGRGIYAKGCQYNGEPIMLTEFGGISFAVGNNHGWGYTSAGSKEEFLDEYNRIMEVVNQSEILAGYCYTQLTDVEQEINGLLTYNRQAKVDFEEIKKCNEKWSVIKKQS